MTDAGNVTPEPYASSVVVAVFPTARRAMATSGINVSISNMPSPCIAMSEVEGETISPTFASMRVTIPEKGANTRVLTSAARAFSTSASAAATAASLAAMLSLVEAASLEEHTSVLQSQVHLVYRL